MFCSGTLRKTNVAVEGHVGEFTCIVVVDDTGDFVCKCAEAEHIGNGLVIVVVDDDVLLGRMGNVIVGVGIVGFDKAGHVGVRDGSRDLDAGLFWSGRKIPLHGCFMWPFEVAMLGGRYLATFFPLRWGAPRRNPRRMASRRDNLGGLHKLWCMNLTLFSVEVRWYEKLVSSCGVSLVQGPSGSGCGASGVVRVGSLGRIGSVHKSLMGSL